MNPNGRVEMMVALKPDMLAIVTNDLECDELDGGHQIVTACTVDSISGAVYPEVATEEDSDEDAGMDDPEMFVTTVKNSNPSH